MRRFVPFMLLLFLIAVLLRVDFFFTIAYLFFAVYALGRIWAKRMAANLRVERRFIPRALFGERVTVEVAVRNAGRLPIPWVHLHETLPVDLAAPPFHREVLSLGPRELQRFRYMLHCRHRGYYRVGALFASTGDLLGVAVPRPLELKAQPLIVYPRLLPLERLGLPTRSPLVALPARVPLFEDPAKVTGVRDYQRGDSPRRIHWTATASAGRLLVKQYQPAIARETLICLDLDEGSYDLHQRYDATELAIVVAASLANHIAVRERLPVGLLTEMWDPLSERRVLVSLPPRPERAHLMSVLDVLARAKTTSATPLPALVRGASVRLRWGATLAVVTGRESEALFDALAYLRRAGFAVALILVRPGRTSRELKRRAGLLGIPIHQVWDERDVEGLR